MILFRIACCAVAIFAVTASSVRADDICLADAEEKAAKAAIAAMSKAEQSGQSAELFEVSRSIAGNDCIDRFDKNAQARAKANVPKLGRDLAKVAEAKGFLYLNEPVRADGRTSAFRYFEAIGDFNEANRVMLKAVHAKPDDLTLFETAWGVDRGHRGPRDPKTGEIQPHVSLPAYLQQEEMGRAMRKTGENVKGTITQKSEADQKRFNDKKADLGKEAWFLAPHTSFWL